MVELPALEHIHQPFGHVDDQAVLGRIGWKNSAQRQQKLTVLGPVRICLSDVIDAQSPLDAQIVVVTGLNLGITAHHFREYRFGGSWLGRLSASGLCPTRHRAQKGTNEKARKNGLADQRTLYTHAFDFRASFD